MPTITIFICGFRLCRDDIIGSRSDGSTGIRERTSVVEQCRSLNVERTDIIIIDFAPFADVDGHRHGLACCLCPLFVNPKRSRNDQSSGVKQMQFWLFAPCTPRRFMVHEKFDEFACARSATITAEQSTARPATQAPSLLQVNRMVPKPPMKHDTGS